MREYLLFLVMAAVSVAALVAGVPGPLILVLLAALIGSVYYRSTVLPRRRRAEAVRHAVTPLGLAYEGQRDPFAAVPDAERYRLEILRSPGAEYTNVARGTRELGETLLFDFRWADSGGEGLTHRQTVAAFQLRGCTLPQFSLRRRRALDTLGAALSRRLPGALGLLRGSFPILAYQEVDVAPRQPFAERHLVQGPDAAAVRALFGPAVCDAWASHTAEGDWAADGAGEWLIAFREDALIAAPELGAFLGRAEAIGGALRAAAGGTTPSVPPAAGRRTSAT